MAQFAQHTNKIDSLSSYYILTLEHSLRSFSFYSTFLLPFVSSPSKTVIRNKGPHPLSQFLPCDAAEAPSISRVGHKSCNPYPFKNQRSPLDKEYTVSVHSTRARARGKENSYQIAFNVSDDKRLRQGERRGDRERERLRGKRIPPVEEQFPRTRRASFSRPLILARTFPLLAVGRNCRRLIAHNRC